MEVSLGGAWGPNFFDVYSGDFGGFFVMLAESEQSRGREHAHVPLPVLGERGLAHLGDLAGDVVARKWNGLVKMERMLRGDDDAVVEGTRTGERVAAGELPRVDDVVVLGDIRKTNKGGVHRRNLPWRRGEGRENRCCSKKRILTRPARKRGPPHKQSHRSQC